jgi:hypothetical protein
MIWTVNTIAPPKERGRDDGRQTAQTVDRLQSTGLQKGGEVIEMIVTLLLR